jgi:hypothetical protein
LYALWIENIPKLLKNTHIGDFLMRKIYLVPKLRESAIRSRKHILQQSD